MRRPFAAMLLIALPGAACAHPGHPHGELPGWTLDASVTLPLALALLLYGVGLARLGWRSRQGQARLRREARLFGAGWLVLAIALVSPLHEAGERSFTMHMIEHELIMLVAALLLAISGAGPVLLWGLPAGARRGIGRLLHAPAIKTSWKSVSGPWIATALQAIALWLWHAPALFDRALASEGWHIVQHLSFLVTALLFWWSIDHTQARRRIGVAVFCLLLTACVGAALGALMALSSSPWYAGYAAMGMTPYGLTPEQDQQMAGLIMWIPGGIVHMGAALVILYRWLAPQERRHAVATE
ncbi:MAG: cytochrome c oxidase assembly protein [Sphingomonas sp.]|nr:cytochrome c oxidase assembly protein [Sphingomonas sp.]